MVKVIAKRRLAFRNKDDGTFKTVMPGVFETLPDWVQRDPLFAWAVKDGSLEIVTETITPVNVEPVETKQEQTVEPKQEKQQEKQEERPRRGRGRK